MSRAQPPLPDPLPLPVVDNHTHLDISRDEQAVTIESLGAVLAQAAAVGVERVVQIGCDVRSAAFAVEIAHRYPAVLAGVALHPNEAPRLAARGELGAAYAEIERISADPRVREIGETGLDYFRTGAEGVAAQQDSFRWHIDLAKRLDKVLQIHDRDAHDDVLSILAREGAPRHTVLHCFSGDQAMARECAERGYVLSFSGTVTFKSAQSLRDALAVTPIEQVLVETDAPYLTPHPWRGASNAPHLMPVTVRVMAQVLGVSVAELCAVTTQTAERLYGPW